MLAAVLLRFAELTAGSYHIDGHDVRDGERRRLPCRRALRPGRARVRLHDSGEPAARDRPGCFRGSTGRPPTAADLTDDLPTATTGRAVLLITHRLDGLDQVNEILVLDPGRVVERGTHAELLRAKGRFHDLSAGRGAAPAPD